MGSVCANGYGASPEENSLDKVINRKLFVNHREDENVSKILLLGAGECGKSTILKQMQILYQGGWSPEEKIATYRGLIRKNTVDSMVALIKACRHFSIDLEDKKADTLADDILDFQCNDDESPSPDLVEGIGQKIDYLFKNESIQTVYCERSPEFYLLDSAPYFLNIVQRTFKRDYIPEEQDILRSRIATVGIIESNISCEGKVFKFYDVGGQRGERKKWIHCFDKVRAIMFVAASSEYDQFLEEDRSKNRMQESLDLFKSITNLLWFKQTAKILFLNKEDIFLQKIEKIDLGAFFPEYTGGCQAEEAFDFIRNCYMRQLEDEEQIGVAEPALYIHRTNATDTKHFQTIWCITKHIVLTKNLERAGLVL